jgi:hypothetical protein
MENYKIKVTYNKKTREFEITDCPHDDNERCKYKVFENGVYVASFKPDSHYFVHPCQNKAGLDEKLLNLLAEQIEIKLPHPTGKHFKPN